MSWKEIAGYALETSRLRGASYADVRVVDDRQRMLLTKNGKVGYASDSEPPASALGAKRNSQ